jgi:hypothetical protein
VDVVYGLHVAAASLRGVAVFIWTLPRTVTLARSGEIPARAAFSIGYRHPKMEYFKNKLERQSCGCYGFRGHLQSIDIECGEHWLFGDDDDLHPDDEHDGTGPGAPDPPPGT